MRRVCFLTNRQLTTLFLLQQVLANLLYQVDADKESYYETLEKMYDVQLHHFKRAKDEL